MVTICIAAACGGAKAVVVAADRMVTASYPPVEFEHDMPKLERIGNACVALTAGDALAHVDLFRAVKDALAGFSAPSIAHTADVIQKTYVLERLKSAEQKFLNPRGWTIAQFYSDIAKVVPPDLFLAVDHQIATYDYGLDILLAGIDVESHIYTIRNPGQVDCFDALGYNAIGSGALHALSTFISSGCSASLSINRAAYLVFEAKRRAEVAPGVGQGFNMAVVTPQGIHELGQQEHNQLDDIYKKRTQPQVDSADEDIEGLGFKELV